MVLPALLWGCATIPLQFTRFDLIPDRKETRTVRIGEENYAEFDTPNYKINAVVYEYSSVVVAELIILNRTKGDVGSDQYSVELTDGRDYKPVRLLTRDELIAIKSRYSGGGKPGSMQDQLIESTMNTVMNTLNVPTKDRLISYINQGIDNYFAFRPVYAGESRQGVLCFLPDFKLEYPLTIRVKLKEEKAEFRFLPQKYVSQGS